MNEDFLIQLLQDINNEKIRFGTCDVRFIYHDGIIQYYEISTCKRRNVGHNKNVKQESNYGRER